MRRGRARRAAVSLLKLGAAAAAFGWLLATDRLDVAPMRAVLGDPLALTSMIALQVLLLMLGVLRWWMLLGAIDRRAHSYVSLLAFNWIGQFFGCFAPSAVATDATRLAYVRRTGEATTGAVVTSVVADRIAGITGACLLTIVLAHGMLRRSVGDSAGAWAIGIAALAITAAGTYGARRTGWMRARLASLRERLRVARSLRTTMLAALSISVLAHALKVACLWAAVPSALEPSTSLGHMLTFAPVGFLAEAVPLAPGGFGTTHLAFEYLFGLEGMRGGAAIFTVYFLVRVAVSAVGGVIWASGWRTGGRRAPSHLAP